MSDEVTDYSQFKPREYLNFYYTRIDEENRGLLEFFADSYKNLPAGAHMLEFGGGPTIYQIISAAKQVKKIDFCDYLESNLEEIRAWKEKHQDAFEWEGFTKHALEIEGLPSTTADVEEREELVRDRLGEIMQADAFETNPCGPAHREKYDVMGVIFVPEGITSTKKDWEQALSNILTLLKPGGLLVTAAITGADYWMSGPQKLPAANISEDDFKQTLPKLGMKIESFKTIPSEILDPNDPGYTGYTGMVFIRATKA